MPTRIEDYALIGDSRSGALVSHDGSIDWLCLPRFDSPAFFAALLGEPGNGRWSLAPQGEVTARTRRYRQDTLVLETEFETTQGTVRLTDFMPMGQPGSSVVRLVTGLKGRVAMRMELCLRFDYGRLVPWVTRGEDGTLTAISGPEALLLRTPVEHRGEDMTTVAEFEVAAGESVPFVLSHGVSYEAAPGPLEVEEALRATEAHWRDWAGRCRYEGPWREAVVRSLITLKALTYAPTGGIIAALTTSLPELPGGERNWDYRFCWLRDATFTLLSLMAAGYHEEAGAWRDWLLRAIAGAPSQVQPLYSIRGESRIGEWEASWLAGFEGSRPVRVGNAASDQLQLDIYGELLDAAHHARRHGLPTTEEAWALQRGLLKHLAEVVDQPDRGIWETRDGNQHFTHSKVMSWVAFDRAVCAVERFGLEGPVEAWRALRDRLHAEICERAFDPGLNAFVQAYGVRRLDASALLIPLLGFLPIDDPRVLGTIEAIERGLTVDGLVRRYDTEGGGDGLEGGEGAFLACSFWLADNLILQGRREEGTALFERLLGLRNDVGLLAEEYDVAALRQLGNFPQALSHLALVATACNLADGKAPARERSRHQPAESY